MLFSFFIHYSEGKSPFDHFLLYWVAPFAGALLGGLIWRLTHGPDAAKRPAKRRD
jgi:glycerol uptake facilitator-like aquaporin